jgi:hypothetical protein
MKRTLLGLRSVLLFGAVAYAGHVPNMVYILADDLGYGDF